jgi:hypothetical protein
MTIFLHEDRTMPAYRLDTHRPLPAGCGQQDRYRTRGHGTQQVPDTVIMDDDQIATAMHGSAEPLGDDQAERSGWGGLFDDSSLTGTNPITDRSHAGWWLAAITLLVALVAACFYPG